MYVKVQPNSGAMDQKGDLIIEDYLVQAKTTSADSFRITTQMLNDAKREALLQGKAPLFVVKLGNGKKYWVIEDWLIDRLLQDGNGEIQQLGDE